MRRETDVRLHRRIQAVYLAALGWTVRQAAQAAVVSRSTVYRWVRIYRRTRRVEALRESDRTGRPRSAARLTEARIRAELRRDPLRLGYSATTWTVALLAGHLARRCGLPVSPRTLRRRMRGMGLRWKRPRYAYADKEPHLPQKRGRSSAA
jgi:transposase